jgi:hypothetical protein
MSRIRLLPTGPRQFFLRHAARRGDLFEICWSGPASPPDSPDYFLMLGVDSLGTTAESLQQALEDEATRRALAGGCALLLDCSSEGPALSRDHLLQIHLAFGQLKVSPSRVVLLHHNGRLEEDYRAWLREYPAFAPMRLFEYHFYLQDLVIRRHDAGPDLAQMRALANRSLAGGTRRFVCLNNRSKEHRLVVLGHLARNGLLEDGVVSFRLGRYGEDDYAVDGVIPRAEAAYPGFAEDVAAFRALRPSLPLVPQESLAEAEIAHEDGFALHHRAFLALVAESEMRADVSRFTEKTLKALLNGMPFVVAGNRGTLAALRALGFETFAPLIDETYDDVADAGERLAACLAEFRRLMALDPEAFEALFTDLWPICARNMDHFAHGMRHRSLEQERALVRVLHDAIRAR